MTALQFLLKSGPDHQVPGQPARPRFGEGTRDGSAWEIASPCPPETVWSRSKGKSVMGLPLFLKAGPSPASKRRRVAEADQPRQHHQIDEAPDDRCDDRRDDQFAHQPGIARCAG